jgi:hypothetical protein
MTSTTGSGFSRLIATGRPPSTAMPTDEHEAFEDDEDEEVDELTEAFKSALDRDRT